MNHFGSVAAVAAASNGIGCADDNHPATTGLKFKSAIISPLVKSALLVQLPLREELTMSLGVSPEVSA